MSIVILLKSLKIIEFLTHHHSIAVDIAASVLVFGVECTKRCFKLNCAWKSTNHHVFLEPASLLKLTKDLSALNLALIYKLK